MSPQMLDIAGGIMIAAFNIALFGGGYAFWKSPNADKGEQTLGQLIVIVAMILAGWLIFHKS